MASEFKLPDIGEGVMEGEIIEWHVNPGDQVQVDQPLLSVLTDKATVEIASTQAGTIGDLKVGAGDIVPVGSVLMTFANGAAAPESTSEVESAPTNSQTQPVNTTASSFPLPEIGEGVMEGEVVEWHVEAGANVQADQPIVSMLTDKATVEITAPSDGQIVEILAQPGDIVAVGGPLMSFVGSGGGQPAPVAAPSAAPVPQASATKTAASSAPRAAVAPADNPSISAFGIPLATPAVRQMASRKGIDLTTIRGSGPNNRITKADVENAIAQPASPSTRPEQPKASVPVSAGETREKIRGLRKAIYNSMTKSKQTVPHFTYVEEIEMDALMAMRSELKGAAEQEGVKLTYIPFIAKACALAIKKFPIVNASVDDANEEIVLKHDINIGIAAATKAGLMVPVVHHVDQMNLLDIAREVVGLSERARDRKSTQADLSGGTFTITSLGRLGGLLATPIINHPEVAIFGVHNIVERAVVRDGQIVIRNMMNVAVAFDHRVIDGDVGASFTQEVKSYLENPSKFLLHLS